jgi:CubicO group peptidase (beta-lactamase class C family)
MSPLRTTLLLLPLLSLSALAGAADGSAGPQKLVGLWGSENLYGPTVRGELVIDGRADAWQARLAGFDVAVTHTGAALSFALPGGQGQFRGRLDGATHRIEGQWIQPPDVTNNNSYASPVELKPSQDGVWRGEVAPLEDRLSLYVQIGAGTDGALTASIRNPEFNFGRRGPYSLSLDGSHVLLVSTRNSSDRMTGEYDTSADQLTFTVPNLGGTYVFTRRDRNSAAGFYPATPAASYVYREPLKGSDGWTPGSLEQAGLDPKPLQTLVQSILDTAYAGPHTPYIHSLLIARHGKLALEEYFYGRGAEDTHSTRSAGKTFAGVLTGIALDRGAKFGTDSKVLSLFPEYKDVANLDEKKRAMTVRDLLTMTSGLACDDGDDGSPGNEDTMQNQSQQPDWYKYTLDLPMAKDPGGDQAVYCSAGVNLLGGVVRNATGMPLPEFFAAYYAKPMDIGVYHMNLMPTGDGYMGGGIEMRPRDLLKLGQLYLDGGTWNGRRVVSAVWVKASWQAASAFAADHHYGYTWHIVDVKSGGKDYKLYEAGGNGGQFVIVSPELDLVVGFTAGNYGDFGTWYKFMTELVPQYVISAASGS